MTERPYTEAEYQACREAILHQVRIHIPSTERLRLVFPGYGEEEYLVRTSFKLTLNIFEDLLSSDNTLLPPGENPGEVIKLVGLIHRLTMDLREDLQRYWLKNAGLNYFDAGPLVIASAKYSESEIADAIMDMQDENLRRKLRSSPDAKTSILIKEQ